MIESSLIFDVTGDPSTTVSMSYVIQTHTRRISGQLSGIVPFRRNIESILVPEEDPSAQITFRAVSPLSIIDSVRIIRDITLQTDPVSVRIERNEQSDHRFYEMYVLAFCPTRQNISVALAKGFEIWEVGPDDYDRSSLLSSMLIQGRTGIYLRPDTRHTLRFYFDNVKYEYEMTTDASMAHEYLGESLLTLKITEKDHLRTDLYMEISNTLMCDFIP